MHTYKLQFSRQAEEVLSWIAKRENHLYRRIAAAIDELQQFPKQGKKLNGILKGRYSYRVGNYRIIYSIFDQRLMIYIIDIGHRKEIYRI